MKIVVANSIGIDSKGYYIIHSPSRWSEGVKNKENWFTYYPWELAYCSTLLKKHTNHTIKFLDGCLERLSHQRYFERILREAPDFLVIESASRMIEENLRLAKEVKRQLGTKIIFVGHHASVFPVYVLENGADYVCIGEYEYTVLELLQGNDINNILGLYPNKRRPLLDINSLPWPEDEDVSRLSYGTPGEPSSEYLEIQMYGSRGCPRHCDFCVARNVYYAEPNWRQRDINNIIAELKYLKNKYVNLEGIFFDEEEHNVSKAFILKLAKAIIDNALNGLHYEAMCDIRTLDKEMMEAMYNAGYYKLRVGIETINSDVLSSSHKKVAIDSIVNNLKIAKEIGLKTYGTFMIGMPGARKEIDLKTTSFIEKMILDGLLDNVQISICTPQPGTPFYEDAKRNNYIVTEDFANFDGGSKAIVNYPKYSNRSIEYVKDFAYRTREHASFIRNFKKGELLSWMARTYKRHGVILTIGKLIKRFQLETVHFLVNRFYLWRLRKSYYIEETQDGHHILNIVQRYYPSIGGAEIYMKEISERLSRDGYRVSVFTTDAWDLEHFWKSGKKRIHQLKEDINGVDVQRFRVTKFPFHNIVMRVLYRLPFLFSKALFSLPSPVLPGMWGRLFLRNHNRFNLVHISAFPYNSLVYMGIKYAERYNLPVVITPFLHLGEYKNDKVNRYYTRYFQMKLLNRANLVIVQTLIEYNYLRGVGIPKEKIYIVGQGVNIGDITGGKPERFTKKYNIKEPKIVFHVSTKCFDKGSIHLLEAMKRIWQKESNIKLVLAGPPMDDFNRYFNNQPSYINQRCLVLDCITGDEKKDLFAAGDVFVLPSRTDSFGAVFLEAWANKKPVIGVNAGGVPEVIKHEDDGFLIKFGDIDKLVFYIELLLGDRELAVRMGEKGYLRVNNGLTWDNKYKVLKEGFEQLFTKS